MTLPRDHLLQTNRRAYDAMAAADAPLTQIVGDDELRNPLSVVDPLGWLGQSIAGRRVLCLAAGGGRQSSLYAAAGAEVTVVDLSPAMLRRDAQSAQARGHRVRLIEASMDDLSMLPAGGFDIVAHPVSTCYLPDIAAVYRQVARVIAGGGIYVSQHKTPTSLQTATQPGPDGRFTIDHRYYRDRPVPPPPPGPVAGRLREPGATEFLHRWEQILGGLCRAGFWIDDVIEPDHATKHATTGPPSAFARRAAYVAPYVRIKAIRKPTAKPSATLWTPGG